MNKVTQTEGTNITDKVIICYKKLMQAGKR